jgi:hypothetical protein
MSANRCRITSGPLANHHGEALHLSRFGSSWVVKVELPDGATCTVNVSGRHLEWADGVGPFTHDRREGESLDTLSRRVRQWCKETENVAVWQMRGSVYHSSVDPVTGKVKSECVVAC